MKCADIFQPNIKCADILQPDMRCADIFQPNVECADILQPHMKNADNLSKKDYNVRITNCYQAPASVHGILSPKKCVSRFENMNLDAITSKHFLI